MKKTLHHIEPSPPRSAIESKIFRISWRQILCLLRISCARSRLPGRIPFLLIMLCDEYVLLDRESILPKYCNCTSIQKS